MVIRELKLSIIIRSDNSDFVILSKAKNPEIINGCFIALRFYSA